MLVDVAATFARGGLVEFPGMGNVMASTQSEVKALLESRSEEVWNKDLERLPSFYSPDVVYFDLVPGLRYIGIDELRGRFSHWFETFGGLIGQEIRDVHVSASGDLAVAHMLIRASGTPRNGREVGYWVRAIDSCQQSGDRWSITHEHVSLPVDFVSGRAVMDLAP
jgi:ketosteroid isomerase-like protein